MVLDYISTYEVFIIEQIEDTELNIYWEILVRHEYVVNMVWLICSFYLANSCIAQRPCSNFHVGAGYSKTYWGGKKAK